jgi:membrane fusion protein, multidrug efflux system
LLLETQKDVTVVPSAAVQRGPQGNYVYVMKPDKTVEVRNVTIPVTQGNLSAIASGVSPNELVVTDGQDKLQQGSHVEPHTHGSGTQNVQGASSDQNAANAPQDSNPHQAQRGQSGKNGNQQRGTASQ